MIDPAELVRVLQRIDAVGNEHVQDPAKFDPATASVKDTGAGVIVTQLLGGEEGDIEALFRFVSGAAQTRNSPVTNMLRGLLVGALWQKERRDCLTIGELVDGYAEGTLCPAAAETIQSIVAGRGPAGETRLLDELATVVAALSASGDLPPTACASPEAVLRALGNYADEVGLDSVPDEVREAIGRLSQ
jgi:hypothetical protein